MRRAARVVEGLRPYGIPKLVWRPSHSDVLAEDGRLREAQKELESGLSARRRLPGLSPWPTLIGLLALAQVHAVRGDRAGARTSARRGAAILEVSRRRHLPGASRRQEGSFARSRGKASSTGSSQSVSSMCFACSAANHLFGR